jgi:hypothetical protein
VGGVITEGELSMYYNKLLLCGRGWMQWTIDASTPRSYPATKTSLQTPTYDSPSIQFCHVTQLRHAVWSKPDVFPSHPRCSPPFSQTFPGLYFRPFPSGFSGRPKPPSEQHPKDDIAFKVQVCSEFVPSACTLIQLSLLVHKTI